MVGINALVETSNLEETWVISCLSLPSHLGAIIPGNCMREEKYETAGPCSALNFMCQKGSSTAGKVSEDGFGAGVVVTSSVAAVAAW